VKASRCVAFRRIGRPAAQGIAAAPQASRRDEAGAAFAPGANAAKVSLRHRA